MTNPPPSTSPEDLAPCNLMRRLGITATLVLVLALIGLGLWGAGDLLVLPAFALVVFLWVVGLLVVVARRLFIDVVMPAGTVLAHLGAVGWEALAGDEEGRRVRELADRAARRLELVRPALAWLGDRIRPGHGGLRRTVAATTAFAGSIALYKLAALVGDETSVVVATDIRIANLAHRIDEPGLRAVMLGLTSAGRTAIMTVIIVVLVASALLARARRPAVLILAVTATSALGVTILKAVAGRERPGIGSLVETSASWPSGHASAGLALGLAVTVGWWAANRKRWPVVAAAVIPVGLLIGYSRAYLTVHWASDVLGGWLVALTATGLVLVADDIFLARSPSRSRLPARALSIAGVLAAVIFSGAAYQGHATQLPAPVEPIPIEVATLDPAVAASSFGPFSETLTGRQIEPVGLIIAVSEEGLLAAVEQAGWSVADLPTVRRLIGVYTAGLRKRDDLTAPVTPTFFEGRMQDIAIEKPVDASAGSVAERHHARLWRLPVVLDNGCPVWVATASLDDRVEWSLRTVLPNHHIDPAIDTEQAYLVADLVGTGRLESTGMSRVTEPVMGTNAAGNPWFTSGTATILVHPTGC